MLLIFVALAPTHDDDLTKFPSLVDPHPRRPTVAGSSRVPLLWDLKTEVALLTEVPAPS